MTLEDILRVQGRGVEGRVVKGEGIMPPTVSQPSVNASIDTGGPVRDEVKGKEQKESCQKVVFLSTHSKAPQASVKVITIQVHHTCVHACDYTCTCKWYRLLGEFAEHLGLHFKMDCGSLI